MRIALVYDLIYPFSIGGVESRNFSLAKELVIQGHEVHLFGVKMWKGKDDLEVSKNFFVHGVSRYSGKYTFKGNRRVFEPFKYSIYLLFKLMKFDFDIVDVSAFPYFPVFSSKIYCMIKKKPLIITWHEVWDSYCISFGVLGHFIRAAEKICSRISGNNLCVSERTSKNLKKIGAKGINMIENWIEIEEIEKAVPLKERYDIISIGRHLKAKNFDLVLKTVSILRKRFPNIKALIIGEGPETVNLLRIRSVLSLEDNVEILSFTKDKEQIFRYLKSSKIFFLPSELEGFSIVSFEAMACGLPVLTLDSERNALSDYIKEGVNGYICKKNELEFAIKIEEMMKSRNRFEKMSRNARTTSQNFDICQKVEEILGYYTSVSKKHRK